MNPSLNRIILATCKEFGITESKLMKRCRTQEIVKPRQASILIMRVAGHKMTTIAHEFKMSTQNAHFARQRAEVIMKKDKEYRYQIYRVLKEIHTP